MCFRAEAYAEKSEFESDYKTLLWSFVIYKEQHLEMTILLFQTVVRSWEDCLTWSPSWKRRWRLTCVTYQMSLSVRVRLMSRLPPALDPEFNVYRVRGSQAPGLMVEERSRRRTWRSGKQFCYGVASVFDFKQSVKHAHSCEREIKMLSALQTGPRALLAYCCWCPGISCVTPSGSSGTI